MSAPTKPMSAVELKAARSAAAARFKAVAMLYVPEGYTVEYRKSLTGTHYGGRKLIQAPRPITRKALYVFLHECAHAMLGHSHKSKVPRHVEEMQAEQWAHAKMRKHGVAVPRSMTRSAKQYVAYKIRQATQRGAKHIDPKARAFARTAPTAD
jgi:RES domain-containing protein